jgi:oxygen-independent coproporphyrinogen III oxidase
VAGIYIHIPFCRVACHYCDFHFSVNRSREKEMTEALVQEIKSETEFFKDGNVETLYFGGGTPSLLEIQNLKPLFQALESNFSFTGAPEITLEANPDDVSKIKVKEWMDLGVNRISLGVQSFFEEDLKWMNRSHNAAQAESAVKILQDNGIENITLDLIYGYPLLTDGKWKSNLEKIQEFGIPHFSSYAMTVEDKTLMGKKVTKGEWPPMDEDQQANQFLFLRSWSLEAGIPGYEISNYARPGMESKHNSAYWSGKKYLGIGPSAHSYDGEKRRYNPGNNSQYIRQLEEGKLVREEEVLSSEQVLNEKIMTGLRLSRGLDLGALKLGEEMENRDKRLILTPEGMLLGDKISADLFF